MSDCMTFPKTVEEFMEQYKMVDTEQIYSNGTAYVPIFRMEQWFEHLPSTQPERTGKWINKWNNDSRYCDQCGAVLEGDYWYWRNNYYCYHCGAKMEVEQNG